MERAGADTFPHTTLSLELLVAAVIAIFLLGFGALRFPESVLAGGPALALSLSALVVYGAVAAWAGRSGSPRVKVALASGTWVGVLLGAVSITNHWLEDFADLRPPVPAVLGVSMWGMLFLCFGGVGALTYRRLGSIVFAGLASAWSGMVSTAMVVVFAIALALSFMPRMQIVLAEEFQRSGVSDPRAFVVRNLFDAASSHLVIAPVVAAVAGLSSAWLSSVLRTSTRRTRRICGVVAPVLLAAGIASIHHASSIDRSLRPPYVMFGLLALGVSLVSAFPLAVSLRQEGIGSKAVSVC